MTSSRPMAPRGPWLAPALLLAGSALAQPVPLPPGADPGVLQQREIEREQRQRADELRRNRIEQPVAPVAPPAAPQPSAADNVQIAVREIRYDPASELLPAADLEALAAPYRGRTVRLSELRELVSRINELYRSRGVVTAQAVLPPQDVTEGVIRIRLVEGRVGQVRLKGNATTRDDYITERLSLQPRSLVALPQLEDDLLRFNRSNDAQLRADLLPGAAPGETDIALTVAEPKRDDLRVFTDNYGSTATGEQRVGITYVRRSLMGRRDDLFVSRVAAAGHQGQYITYALPVSRRGTRLTAGFFDDRTRIVNGPIEPLNITGNAQSYSLQLRHPLLVTSAVQLDGLATLKKRHTANFVASTQLTASTLHSASVGLDLQSLDAGGYWTATGELGQGTDRIAVTSPRDYTVLRGTVRRTVNWSPAVTLSAGLTWQYASLSLLPSSEQLVIGGEGSVRGYSTGLFAGDRGQVVNLEARRRIELQPDVPWTLAAFVFADYGQVRPFRPVGNTRGSDILRSMGGGLDFAWNSRVSARVALGVPIHRRVEEPATTRALVQVTWSLL